MASIRTRITATYALALSGTMIVFATVIWAGQRQIAERELSSSVARLADLGGTIVSQAVAQGERVTEVNDPLVGRVISAQLRPLLEGVPDYLIVVGDSARTLYNSFEVRQLPAGDLNDLYGAIYRLTPDRPAARVDLETDQVLLVAHFVSDPRTVVRSVVAGRSTRSLSMVRSDVLELFFLVVPGIALISVVTAWVIAGRLLQPVDRMIDDVEAITDGRSLHRRIPVEDDGDEIGRLGVTLNAMIGRLEASFAALRRFTADASHELKTPLTVLRADLERAMSVPSRGTEQLVALEEALGETTRMAGLVESLLTLARADEGRFDLHRESLRVEAVVRDVGETALILGEEAGILVTLDVIEPVTVLGDAVRLRQLFLNLVTNAIKYTPRGGHVGLSLQAVDGSAVFTVKDTGIGIAAADLPFIFDRFWRVDLARSRSGERSGVGLGLAISQWIAQAHGGSISVASRLGRGSTFTVTLPASSSGGEV